MTDNPRNATMDPTGPAQAALRILGFADLGTPALSTLASGDVLGGYIIEELIGRGSFGEVYRARDDSLGRRVALKVLPPNGERQRRDRRRREARLLARLDHPAVVQVYGAGNERGLDYVAMQLVEGGTLRQLLMQRREDGGARHTSEDVVLLARIASGLAASHEAGVLHRDLKPENVLLNAEGQPQIADFGLARSLELNETVTVGFAGTLAYASPEQVRGEKLSAASDVFSFGAMAFELLTGARPFRGPTHAQISENLQYREPVWPNDAQVPAELVSILECCLHKLPADRYASGAQLSQDIERFRRFEPIRARKRGPVARVVARVRLRPRRFLLGTAIALLTIASLALLGLSARDRATLDEERAALELAAALEAFHSGETATALLRLEKLAEEAAGEGEAANLLADMRVFEGAVRFERPGRLESELTDGFVARTAWEHARVGEDALCLMNYALAEEHLNLSVQDNPSSYPWRMLRGTARLRSGRAAEAEQDYAIARQLRPDSPEPLSGTIDSLVALQRAPEALRLARAVATLQPESPRIASLLGHCLNEVGLSEEALEVNRQAFARAPQDRRVLGALLNSLIELEQFAEAEDIIRGLDDTLKNTGNIENARARIAISRGDWSTTLACCKKLRTIPGWEPVAVLREARVHAARGDQDAALASYEELTRLQPNVAGWHTARGELHSNLEQYRKAEACFDAAMALDPTGVRTLLLRGHNHRKLSQHPEAILDYTKAVGLFTDNPWPHFHLAETWLELDEPQTALIFASAAVRMHPTWFDANVLKSECLERLGLWNQATEALAASLQVRADPRIRARHAAARKRAARASDEAELYAVGAASSVEASE